jgi:hypothetical protein
LDNQRKDITSEGHIRIQFDVPDFDFPSGTQFLDNGAPPISNLPNVARTFTPKAYGTLEQNQWLLDGSRAVWNPNEVATTGFIGETLSDEDGVFNSHPLVTIRFPNSFRPVVEQLTVTWDSIDGHYARDFVIRGYRLTKQVFESTIVGNDTVVSDIPIDVQEYDRLTIEVLNWSFPGRRCHIETLGIVSSLTFTTRELVDFTYYQEVDPLSARLPSGGIRFTVDNTTDKFNPYRPGSVLAQKLVERTPVTVKLGFEIGQLVTYIAGGVYYLSEWRAPQNGMVVSFEANNPFVFLRDTIYRKGLYDPAGVTLYDLATEVLDDADLPADATWQLDPILEDRSTVAPLPLCTHLECLQLIANAGNCFLHCDRQGVIRIDQPPGAVLNPTTQLAGTFHSGSTFFLPKALGLQAYNIDSFNSYKNPEITLTKPIGRASVQIYSYTPSTDKSTIYEGTVQADGETTMEIEYSSPATAVSLKSITGGTLVSAEYYSNGATLTISGSGPVDLVIEGKTLSKTTRSLYVGDGEGAIQPVENPLVTDHLMASDLGAWVLGIAQHRKIVELEWRADPRLDTLDIVNLFTPFGTSNIIMTNLEMTYRGSFYGRGEGRDVGPMGIPNLRQGILGHILSSFGARALA